MLEENSKRGRAISARMSRYGPPNDIPQRWDRDRFERFSGRAPPPRGFEDSYRYEERDRPGRREVAVQDRVDERGPWGRFEERDRYFEEDRYSPRRPRRRTDRELFGDVDPRELADMALTPYRRKSISREELDFDRHGPPRPGLLRRQSSLDTFDRKTARYEREQYRIPPYTPVPLPIRKGREEEFEEVRYRDYEPEDYREVEIQRERSVHRRKPKSEAPSRRSKAKSVSTRRSSPGSSSSSSSSESFEEIEKAESVHGGEMIKIQETERKFKKGKTRMPKRLVRREAIMDLGYPFDEDENFFVLRIALDKEQIDEVIKISEIYNDGEKSERKKVYRFEEKIEETVSPPPPAEHEEVVRTEWVNPPTVLMAAKSDRARSVRAGSPSARSSVSRQLSPGPSHTHRSRSTRRSHSRRPSSPGTFIEERKTVIEEGHFPPPPPIAVPAPPEFTEERRTIIEERAPSHHSHGGALVVQEREFRSDRDIQAEIARLEAERRALRLEREAEEKRDLALRIRERPEDEFQLVEYRETRPREVLEIVERERSPPRNVIRVEKDRKGRMALVRSAH